MYRKIFFCWVSVTSEFIIFWSGIFIAAVNRECTCINLKSRCGATPCVQTVQHTSMAYTAMFCLTCFISISMHPYTLLWLSCVDINYFYCINIKVSLPRVYTAILKLNLQLFNTFFNTFRIFF